MAIKNPSKYQLEIFKAYSSTKKNIFIQASAGSGKSSTIVELISQTPIHKKVCVVSFNKNIADEMRSKVRPTIDVSTLHSKGAKLLREYLPCSIKVNEIKTWILAKNLFRSYLDMKYKKNEKLKSAHLFILSRLYDLYRMNVGDQTVEDLTRISESYAVDADPIQIEQTLELITHLEHYNNNRIGELMIDFTDMLWLTYKFVKSENYPKYDIVYIDEVQDITVIQKRLIDNLIKKNGRFVCCGDSRQSIYNFMGANIKVLESFRDAPNTISLPLSVSYRCGKRIVQEANKIFDGMEAFEGNPEGIVRYGKMIEVEGGDFVLCRNNLPLVDSYINLLSQNKRAYILGKDLGKSLTLIMDKIDVIEDIDTILEEKKAELKGKGVFNIEGNKAFQSLLEKCQIIRILYDRFQSLNKVSTILEEMFADEDQISRANAITLSTIHKIKGREAKRVFITNIETIPSQYATTPNELYAEQCLLYVAVTRSKEELVIVTYDDTMLNSPNIIHSLITN